MEAHVVGIRELLFLEHLQLLPNIVRIVNSCSINGFYFLELEKSYDLNVAKEGIILDDKYNKSITEIFKIYTVRPPPNFDETMLIANSVLDALRYLHNFGIFHMDVKPANIVWTLEGNVKLCDFGTAEISPFNGKVKGTTYYSAPELIRTNWSLESVSSKCDIYSFGVTILGE